MFVGFFKGVLSVSVVWGLLTSLCGSTVKAKSDVIISNVTDNSETVYGFSDTQEEKTAYYNKVKKVSDESDYAEFNQALRNYCYIVLSVFLPLTVVLLPLTNDKDNSEENILNIEKDKSTGTVSNPSTLGNITSSGSLNEVKAVKDFVKLPKCHSDEGNNRENSDSLKYYLNRFKLKQNQNNKEGYSNARKEILKGHKENHWIWWIFPQIYGLVPDPSDNTKFYSIKDELEARAFLLDNELKKNLVQICQDLLDLKENKSALDIFGGIDVMKVKSSMTLFDYIDTKYTLKLGVFGKVLQKYYSGEKDSFTLKILNANDVALQK